MNERDVLGLRLLPGITGKMESTPPRLSAGNAHFPALNRARARRDFWRCWCCLIEYQQVQMIVKEFYLILAGN